MNTLWGMVQTIQYLIKLSMAKRCCERSGQLYEVEGLLNRTIMGWWVL